MNPCLDCLINCCRFGCICVCHKDRLKNLFEGNLTLGQIRSRAKVIGMELAEK